MSAVPLRKERMFQGEDGRAELSSGAVRGRQQERPLRRPRADAVLLKDDSRAAYHVLWVSTLLLLGFGLCMLLSVSMAAALEAGDKFAYVRQQAWVALVGVGLLGVVALLDYRRLRYVFLLFACLAALLLILVHVPILGKTAGGSTSWLRFGSGQIQPSELAKLAVVLTGAHFLSRRRRGSGEFASFMWPFGAAGLAMCGLVVLEGDLGTAVIIAGLILGMAWIGGMRFKHWSALVGGGMLALLVLVITSKERLSRFTSFHDPSADPSDSGYQLMQSLIALGRGGWLGVGPGQSVQKFQYLPEAHTDMIFSILGEELGLLGSALVILLFLLLAVASWRLASRCAEPMGRYVIAGCGMLISLQAVINIGGVTGALPLTGVPLPFISYGRSSLVVMLLAVGLMLSVARHAPAVTSLSQVKVEHGADTHSRRRHSGPRRASAGLS